MGPPDLTADFTNLRSTLHERGVAADV